MAAQMIGARARAGRPSIRFSLAEDERLARLVGGDGSERAFGVLYERYHQPLYRYCRSMLRNDADAQDALQSALAGAFAALRRGRRDAPLRPWLFRIAHNESVSLLRRRRPECELSEALDCPAVSVEKRVEERARLAVLVADLSALPERQRGALVMRELSGLPHEEIAVALGVSVGAAKQSIFEARRSLLEFSEGRAMACEEVRRMMSDADGRARRGRRVRAHLRDCSGCAAFAAAIPARSADLRAIAPPLPAVAAAGLFARAVGGGSGHGAGSAGGLAAGAAGKTAGLAFAAKALAGVAIVATATVGATTALRRPADTAHRPQPATRINPAGHSGMATSGTERSSPGFAGGARARHAAKRRAVGVGAASVPAGTTTRSGDRARVVASGFGAGGSGVARGGAGARGLPFASARTTPSRGVSHRPTGSSIGSQSAQHRGGPPASARATGRPSPPAAGRPSTPAAGRSSTPTAARSSTPTAGRSSTPSATTPSIPSRGAPGAAAGSTPRTFAAPATPFQTVPPTPRSGSAQLSARVR
jgi:RNA polymerase sigma factor (sigma-70 family)